MIANTVSTLTVAAVAFAAAELYKVRRLDGLWTCMIYFEISIGVAYQFRGVVLDVQGNAIDGEAAAVFVRSSDQQSWMSVQAGAEPFKGAVTRVAFLFPDGVRIRGRLMEVTILLELDFSGRRYMVGRYISETDRVAWSATN